MGFVERIIYQDRDNRDKQERSLTGERVSLRQRLGRLERSKGMQIFLWITVAVLLLYAVFAFLYTTVVIYASGKGTSFLWFWPVTFCIALAAAAGLFFVLTGRLPGLKKVAIGFSILFWICMAIFFSVETVIFMAGRKAPEKGAAYVVVLGAQVRGEIPTLVLQARIKAAAEYLKEYPDAVAVASGGKGSGESISEAEAIKRGLVRLGIEEERILLEESSTSTAENLKFSAEIIPEYEQADVVVVTNDFHVYRAVHLAERLGYTRVSGLGATEFFAVTIQYYVREFFALIAGSCRGNF